MFPLERGGRLEPNERASLLFVIDGLISVSSFFPDGRRQILHLHAPGSTILPAESATYSIEALAHSYLRITPLPNADKGREQLIRLTNARLESANARLLTLGRLGGHERVAAFLTDMCIQLGRSREGGGVSLHLPMTRDDIADYLGLTAETVSRFFARLKRANMVIFLTPSELLVPDLSALEALTPITISKETPIKNRELPGPAE